MKLLHRVVLSLGLVLSVGCSREPTDTASTTLVEPGGASLFDLPVKLTDQNGQELSLEAFRGQPTIVSMFYASCPYACPTLISDVRRLEDKLDPAARKHLRVLLVSFDTKRDTPDRLAALLRERHLDEKRWTLARASENDVRSLAAALDFKYRALESGEFNHSSAIILLRPDGTTAARVEGLAQPLDEMTASATSLLRGEI